MSPVEGWKKSATTSSTPQTETQAGAWSTPWNGNTWNGNAWNSQWSTPWAGNTWNNQWSTPWAGTGNTWNSQWGTPWAGNTWNAQSAAPWSGNSWNTQQGAQGTQWGAQWGTPWSGNAWDAQASAKTPWWWASRCEFTETDKDFVMTTDMPGWDKKDISIWLDKDMLTLKSERKWEEAETKETWGSGERNWQWGPWERHFLVPETRVDREKVSAKFENGVLTVWLGKTAEAQKQIRKVDIK